MPGLAPILELLPAGDVIASKLKFTGAKPTLKDLQTHLKKKVLPTVLTAYPYGSKRVTLLGYTKGKDTEASQHQLPPPCEETELYGTIVLIVHSSKTTWDTTIEPFSVGDYEAFYEKACSGELEEDDDEDDAEEDEAVVEEDEGIEDDEADIDADVDVEVDEAEEIQDEEEVPAPRVRAVRKVKIDPQQLQFQFKSTLVVQTEVSAESVAAVKVRQQTVDIFKTLVGEHCNDTEILQLEMGIFNASIDEANRRLIPLTWDHETFKWIYTMISKRTVSNFQPSSYVGNNRLIERWKDGEFTLDAIGHWTPYELDPVHWKDLKDQQFRREQRILEGNLAMATDRFRCSRCQKKLCSYYELQTRSADEPMTIFISCLNCGKRWKQ